MCNCVRDPGGHAESSPRPSKRRSGHRGGHMQNRISRRQVRRGKIEHSAEAEFYHVLRPLDQGDQGDPGVWILSRCSCLVCRLRCAPASPRPRLRWHAFALLGPPSARGCSVYGAIQSCPVWPAPDHVLHMSANVRRGTVADAPWSWRSGRSVFFLFLVPVPVKRCFEWTASNLRYSEFMSCSRHFTLQLKWPIPLQKSGSLGIVTAWKN